MYDEHVATLYWKLGCAVVVIAVCCVKVVVVAWYCSSVGKQRACDCMFGEW